MFSCLRRESLNQGSEGYFLIPEISVENQMEMSVSAGSVEDAECRVWSVENAECRK